MNCLYQSILDVRFGVSRHGRVAHSLSSLRVWSQELSKPRNIVGCERDRQPSRPSGAQLTFAAGSAYGHNSIEAPQDAQHGAARRAEEKRHVAARHGVSSASLRRRRSYGFSLPGLVVMGLLLLT